MPGDISGLALSKFFLPLYSKVIWTLRSFCIIFFSSMRSVIKSIEEGSYVVLVFVSVRVHISKDVDLNVGR